MHRNHLSQILKFDYNNYLLTYSYMLLYLLLNRFNYPRYDTNQSMARL